MDPVTIGLRLIHIVSGTLWVGGAALFFFYIEPTINKLGPDAERFVDEMMNKRKAPVYFMIASTLTVLAGVILYWRNTAGFTNAWMTSPAGIVFGIGGIAAIIAWLGGNLLIPGSVNKVGAIAAEMKAAGGPPSAELMARMHAAQERLRKIGMWDLILIGIAVVAMAIARYLG